MTQRAASQQRRSRGGTQPSPLSQADVIEAALRVTEASGLEGLTIRAVADELGVTSPAVYHYMRGKEDLIDRLCERVAEQIDLEVDPEMSWSDQIVQIILQMDSTFARYPGVAPRVLSSFRPSPAANAISTAVRRVLEEAGFTIPEARELSSALHFLFSGWLVGKPPVLRDQPITAGLLERCVRGLLDSFATTSKNEVARVRSSRKRPQPGTRR